MLKMVILDTETAVSIRSTNPECVIWKRRTNMEEEVVKRNTLDRESGYLVAILKK